MGALLVGCGTEPAGHEDAEPAPTSAPVSRGTDPDGGAFGVSRPRLTVRPTARRGPAVAFDGTLYLVVWHDERTGGVFGTRVRKDGTLLDPAGIALNLGTGVAGGRPAVAHDGKQFLVVWLGPDGVYGTHVRRDGTTRDERILFTGSDEVTGDPAVACGRGVCLVAYTGTGDEESVIVADTVDREGRVLTRKSLTRGGTGRFARDPTIAFGVDQFLVAWGDARGGEETPDIYGARVRPDGTVLDVDGVPLVSAPGAQVVPDVDWTGSHFLLVWEDRRGETPDVYGARVRSSAVVEEPAGFPISTGPGAQQTPRVAHLGRESLVVWGDTRSGPQRIRGARVEDTGAVVDAEGVALSSGRFPEEELPDVTAGSRRFFTGYGGAGHILGTRVTPDATAQDVPALLFTRSANAQESPTAAFGAGASLVVWRELRVSGPVLLATRVLPGGRVPAPPIQLPAGSAPAAPAVAFDGSVFLVVWQEDGPDGTTDVRGARVSRAGALLDAQGFTVSAAAGDQRTPAVAASDSRFLVVWQDSRATFFGNASDVYGARVTGEGAVLDADGFRISGVDDTQDAPGVTFADGTYLVAWRTFRFVPPPTSETRVEAARVTDAGAVLDTPPILVHRGPVSFEPLALSSDGTRVLVAWSDDIFGPASRILAARVGPGGTVLDASPIPVAAGAGFRRGRPAATFDGRVHRVVWEQAPVESVLGAEGRTDIFTARVSTAGTVLEPEGEALAHQRAPELEPVVVSTGPGEATAFYTAFVTDRAVSNLRVLGRPVP